MKVTIVTVVFNCAEFIEECIQSVLSQDYPDIEYLLIDGGSTDGTLAIVNKYSMNVIVSSEVDLSMYDGLNKAIGKATGEVIGIVNADDKLATSDVISSVVNCFRRTSSAAIYGNLHFTNRLHPHRITRIWNSRIFNKTDIMFGWMPPHPTLYIKREIFLQYGNYSLVFGNCADYELILRLLFKYEIKIFFLNKLLVIMRSGGMSNSSFMNIFTTFYRDFKSLKSNGVPFPIIAVCLKKLRKIRQLRYV